MNSGQSPHSPSVNRRHKQGGLSRRADDCEPADPANTVTDRLNNALRNGGAGYTLRLCPNQRYFIQAPILFSQPNQEISTAGYPRGDERAMLVVSGPVADGKGHTIAVDGTCNDCDGVKLRNIQIDGTRGDASPTDGGGNIEMGGDNSNQLIEYVRSFNPRSWTCLHIAEGPLTCNNVVVQNNDLGPCGVDTFQQWADGISIACRNSVVRDNMIQGATDGGIVVFGSPGTLIENNTIWVLNQTLLGGINLVDYNPFSGDYTNTIVRNNAILGGFANDGQTASDTRGSNYESAIIKIGIAIGPRTWFGDRFGQNRNRGGVVQNNKLAGAFSYGIAVTSADDFTITGNTLLGNTTFIGAKGPNCSDTDHVPTPGPWIVDWATVGTDMNAGSGKMQGDLVGISDGDSLTCVLPPNGGDFWPFGSNPSNSSSSSGSGSGSGSGSNSGSNGGGGSGGGGGGNAAGIGIGVVVALLAVGVIGFFGRRWWMKKQEDKAHYNAAREMAQRSEYTQRLE
ncbi:hypothetical protein EST38_g10745 [Candolleomyces aberdarensis]|uniref:Uncharacterized protein n=1 Tax=Candolleomyces aberdarensis TaxID=2316362 RepID=A0A4Q2D881_9AGAR|nr:hypothetical protein EST38_g10745 [Candolleomyces aberdarensis]